MNAQHIGMIGPDLDAMGGIATVIRTWLSSPALHGVQVDFHGSMRDASTGRKAALMAWRQARFIARLAGGWRPQLFHIHLSYFNSFYRKLAYFQEAHATGRPVLVHLHAPDLQRFHDAARLHAAAMRWMFSRAARVIALSNDMAGIIRGWMGDEARIEVLYNPVDLRRFTCPPRPDRDDPLLLFMGMVGERKGAWDLIETVPSVLERVPGARFRFCGNGEVERLKERVDALGLTERVQVPGWVSGDEMVRQYREADVYCLPSYHEGLPMSVLEAMGAGLPVISTAIAGIPEAVTDGETGFLVSPGDRDALRQGLVQLLGDSELRRRMGAAGRARAEDFFDVDVLVRQLRAIWDRVLAESPGPDSER